MKKTNINKYSVITNKQQQHHEKQTYIIMLMNVRLSMSLLVKQEFTVQRVITFFCNHH